MRRIPAVVYVLGLVLFILLGSNYLASNSNRADAESIGLSNKGPTGSGIGNQLPVVEEPPAAEPDSQAGSGEGVTGSAPNEEVDQPAQPKFLIDVNVSDQKVRIFENDKMIKEWLVSTGQNDSTPLGRFTIQNRGEWFFSEKYQQGAMWWVSFKDWGVYLFHSLPMDRDRSIITEEAEKLGSPASHGCVRLEIDKAKWIYDNIPQGTDVYIHK